MANQIYRDRVISLVKTALLQYEQARQIDHLSLRGRIREIAAAGIFKHLLPLGFEVGAGKIIDAQGFQSPETDLVIYSRSVLSPIMYSEREGIFPAEASIYSIEVKSQITAQELDDAIRKARETQKLTYVAGQYDANDKPIDHDLIGVIRALFAFSSDLGNDGKTELERYKERDSEANVNPSLGVICVVGRGYWWFNRNQWNYLAPTEDTDEVVDFVSAVVNTLHISLASRGHPRLGNYLVTR